MHLIATALAAMEDVGSAPFRVTFLKVLGWTVGLLAIACIVGVKLAAAWIVLPHAVWLATSLHVLTALGLVAALTVLVVPVSFAVASFFFDELAAVVEERCGGPVGRSLPFWETTRVGLVFSAVSLLVNLAALLLLLVPGVNAIAFFGANAYLLGRGFFELAALRHGSVQTMRALRRRYRLRIIAGGCICAALAAVPFANVLTPLFATAVMVRLALPIVQGAGTPQLYRAV